MPCFSVSVCVCEFTCAPIFFNVFIPRPALCHCQPFHIYQGFNIRLFKSISKWMVPVQQNRVLMQSEKHQKPNTCRCHFQSGKRVLMQNSIKCCAGESVTFLWCRRRLTKKKNISPSVSCFTLFETHLACSISFYFMG